MELITGQVVWIAFAAGHSSLDGRPHATVHRVVVLDGENRIVKRDSGHVGICHTWSVEQPHATEAEAWSACADLLERYVVAVEQKAQECRRAAAVAKAAAKAATLRGVEEIAAT